MTSRSPLTHLTLLAQHAGLWIEFDRETNEIHIGSPGWFYRITGPDSMSLEKVADLAIPVLQTKEGFNPDVRIQFSTN